MGHRIYSRSCVKRPPVHHWLGMPVLCKYAIAAFRVHIVDQRHVLIDISWRIILRYHTIFTVLVQLQVSAIQSSVQCYPPPRQCSDALRLKAYFHLRCASDRHTYAALAQRSISIVQ